MKIIFPGRQIYTIKKARKLEIEGIIFLTSGALGAARRGSFHTFLFYADVEG